TPTLGGTQSSPRHLTRSLHFVSLNLLTAQYSLQVKKMSREKGCEIDEPCCLWNCFFFLTVRILREI
uniref:Uncharacterized protein n=1 Tax=Cynoglossus semilaevis TaxID=244447 RepID=A0A3P8WDT5_CYNSE